MKPAISRMARPALSLACILSIIGCGGLGGQSRANDGVGAVRQAVPQPSEAAAPLTPAQIAANDRLYPFYMPMSGLRAPAVKLFIRCDASRAAGREVYRGMDAAQLYGRVEGGYEFVYEALDGEGRPCVYPFAPWQPDVVGDLNGTQFILRSSIPGQRVTFRSPSEWAHVSLRGFDIGKKRIHFEMRDIALDFPGSVQPMGSVHLETFGGVRPGLFSAVIRRSSVFGGKNGIFVPGGQTMLYVEDSSIDGNVGINSDQEHGTYINGTLVSHFRNVTWRGQRGAGNVASGHQLKDKTYLRVYENLTVSNAPNGGPPSAMPLIDASEFGFTWSNNLQLRRMRPLQDPRDALVDMRTEILYGDPANYPWSVVATPEWRMPAAPLGVLDKVYLSVFLNTSVASYRAEPYVFAQRPQGLGYLPGTNHVVGTELSTRADWRAVALAFNTSGTAAHVFSREGWTFADPKLPPGAEWVKDRDAFIRHALGLIGR